MKKGNEKNKKINLYYDLYFYYVLIKDVLILTYYYFCKSCYFSR